MHLVLRDNIRTGNQIINYTDITKLQAPTIFLIRGNKKKYEINFFHWCSTDIENLYKIDF